MPLGSSVGVGATLTTAHSVTDLAGTSTVATLNTPVGGVHGVVSDPGNYIGVGANVGLGFGVDVSGGLAASAVYEISPWWFVSPAAGLLNHVFD